jgi:hypothetical protein
MNPLARPTLAAIAAVALLMGCAALGPRASGGSTGGAVGLRDGARSVDDLMQDLVLAIRENDEGALRRLRVNEEEYRNVILPGSVAPNEAPREYAPKFETYLWGSLDQKNRHSERNLLGVYGGRSLTVENTLFKRGVRVYRGYTAHSQLDLKLRDDKGAEVTFEMGSVAEVGDRYKFISFIRD